MPMKYDHPETKFNHDMITQDEPKPDTPDDDMDVDFDHGDDLPTDLNGVMRALLEIADGFDARISNPYASEVCHAALDWLATLKARCESARTSMDAVRAMEYVACLSNSDGKPVPGTEVTKYMVFNTATISEKNAERILTEGRQSIDRHVVDLYPEEAFALFPALRAQAESRSREEPEDRTRE